jgi:hypothetical protein
VNSAWYHFPSPPQALTLHEPWAHTPVQTMPGVQGAALAAAFRFAASDGAADIAIAATATVPTSRIFEMDFIMRAPSVVKTTNNRTASDAEQGQSSDSPP